MLSLVRSNLNMRLVLQTHLKCIQTNLATKNQFNITPLSSLKLAPQASYTTAYPKRRRKKPLPLPERSAEEAVTNILYDMPQDTKEPIKRHVINALVGNEPGVLSRISGVLAARGFNIDSIICAKTDLKELSRMTIVLNESAANVKQAVRQLQDLVPVWAVLDYTGTKYLERELLMAKVSLHGPLEATEDAPVKEDFYSPQALAKAQTTLMALKQLTDLFQARIVDVSNECIIVELSAKSLRVEAFLNLLKPYGVLEAARSGAMAMQRSSLDSYLEEKEEAVSNPQVDVSSLPPG